MYTYICVYLHVMQVSNSNPDCRFEYIGRPLLRVCVCVCVCVCVLVRAYVIAIGVNAISVFLWYVYVHPNCLKCGQL